VSESTQPGAKPEVTAPAATAGASPRRGHPVVAWVLLVLATLIIVVSSLTVFVKRQVVSDKNWTNASGKMLEDPVVRDAVATYLVNQLFSRVDVAGQLRESLPPKTQALALPLSAAIREVSTRTANALLARPETIKLWKNANSVAHSELMDILNNETTHVSTDKGEVVLDLSPVLDRLGGSLVGEKLLAKLPPDAGRIVLLQSDQLKTAQSATRLLKALSVLLTVVALALLAGAVWLAPDRRRMLLWVGVAAIVAGLIVLVARRLAGNYMIDELTSDVPNVKPAAIAVWGIATQLLRNVGLNLVIYGVAIGLAAALAGPTRIATKLRSWIAPVMAKNPVTGFLAVTGLFLLLLLFGPIDAQRLVPMALLFAAALFGVELLRRQLGREFPHAAETST
jgi:hypothetical protein